MQIRTVNYDSVPVPVAFPDDLAGVLDHIATVKRGRFGVITGHRSGEGNPKCERPTVSNITFITNPKYENWLARMVAGVKAVEFPTWVGGLNPDLYAKIKAKAKGGDLHTLFDTAKAEILASLAKSQAGEATDGHRLGHRLCYATFDSGDVAVKCHLVTEDDGEGHKRPIVNENGVMEVSSLMLPFFAVHRTVTDHGLWLPTDSRALTLVKDAIKDATGIPEWKTISVGKGNFDTLTMDKATVYGLVAEPLRASITVPQADTFAYIAGLAEGFFAVLEALAAVEAESRLAYAATGAGNHH